MESGGSVPEDLSGPGPSSWQLVGVPGSTANGGHAEPDDHAGRHQHRVISESSSRVHLLTVLWSIAPTDQRETPVEKAAASGRRRWPVETAGVAPPGVSPNGAIPKDEAEVGELEIGDLTYHQLNSTTRPPSLRMVDWSRQFETVDLNSTRMVKYPPLRS
ncbi:uncharacterized protein KD926_005491 [Aspergillus affinis]|uniref:uncharacterized protein n=1 Tax=Aspergillus affinis TaxID=1070780 RepID=UPI0022FE4A2E|nr:uncharacterized protein KD926_005491 [Aspergillus affinis]KAI9042413.1 hypothetical protein KD926_005491 [Aspergillus affinis]